MLNRGHHIRCYIGNATDRYLITQWHGAEFIDLRDGNHAINDWLRGACSYGMLPANGLLYNTPDPCNCYSGTKVNGFHAFYSQPERKVGPEPAETGGDLTPPVSAGGRVYVGRKGTHQVICLDAETGARGWSYTAGGRVDSPPTVAAGRVVLGCADGWVYCLDAATG